MNAIPIMPMKSTLINKKLTYVSLFSGAGVGCHGLTQAGFSCVATVENIPRRLYIQKINNKCLYSTGYICGDMDEYQTQAKVMAEVKKWHGDKPCGIDVVIATPPCQGISVCNHKKNNERRRNSLVISALETVSQITPKIFVIENTALFLKTICTLRDGREISIGDAIEEFLKDKYHILSRKVNLKNYGCPSSRTRSLIIGTSKNCWFSPINLWPDWTNEKTLRDVIGDLPPLHKMGEISPNDIYHSFKPYKEHMRAWISNLNEGQSAFEQKAASRRPHTIICGKRKENKNANGDKYRRQQWNASPPCVHTRNDILSSQNTVHPSDDRVFSIREIMRMMSIPSSFKWSNDSHEEISKWTTNQKRTFLLANEINIRQCMGEAAPTNVIYKIATKATNCLSDKKGIHRPKSVSIKPSSIEDFVHSQTTKSGKELTERLISEIEMMNTKRKEHAAYYTTPVPIFKLTKMLPDFGHQQKVKILEPSVGLGRLLHFLPHLIGQCKHVEIDAVDINPETLDIARLLSQKINMPPHIQINYLLGDFLNYPFAEKYDFIISNPPFGRISTTQISNYVDVPDTGSRNIFSLFLAKALNMAQHVVMITPKSLLNAPEFGKLRKEINKQHSIRKICDFGETGFDGVKIETIAIAIKTKRPQKPNDIVEVESVPLNFCEHKRADNIFDENLPYWLIYRNEEFNHIMQKMDMGVFCAFRDRQISKHHMCKTGDTRIIKSRNVHSLKAIFMKDDFYVQNPSDFAVHRFVNREDILLVPNLTYNPRACRLPKNCIPDGSVAVLYPRNGMVQLSDEKVHFFASDEFRHFYRIARNYGTRSLNIDSNSVFFFGAKK